MKLNEGEAKWSWKPKGKRPWEPMKLSYTGHMAEAVKQTGVMSPPPGNTTL